MSSHSWSDLAIELHKYDLESKSPSECARALRALVNKLRESSFYSRNQQSLSVLRFQRLFLELEKNEPLKKDIHGILAAILEFFDLSTLLTQTGLSRPHGFVQELASRMTDKFLPRHSPRPNFMDLVYFLFPVESDSHFLQKMSRDLYEKILSLFDPDLRDADKGRGFLFQHFRTEILDSLMVLSAEVLVLSESSLISDLRWTLGKNKQDKHSFLKLHNYVHQLVQNLLDAENLQDEFSDILAACREELSTILEHLEHSSLSVDLVYQLEVLQLLLERIRALLFIFVFNKSAGPKSLEFFAALVVEEQRRRSVRSLFRQNIHYLSRKIIDNAGETGDHYIARNPLETQDLIKASLGGGFLTGFTALFKILIHNASFALFFEGFFGSINYAGSFIAMQFMHLTLATKQPAMTAASLAKKMTSLGSELNELREEMKNLLKSQVVAAAGNLFAVIPTSYCLFLVWQLFFQKPLLTEHEALAILAAHHPFKSLTIFYALLTGVILWTSSLVQGWVQNWMVFRGIPELLSDSFLVENFLSRKKRLTLSLWLKKNLAGITSNIALGLMLAFTSVAGSFFGLPLEVRHVTLATSAITLAFASLPWSEFTFAHVALAVTGVLLILLCNLLTSFFLSLNLALRAKGWELSDIKETLKSIGMPQNKKRKLH